MASRQDFKEDRAEAAAKLAAKDIGDVNREREREQGFNLNSEVNFKQARAEAAAKLAAKDLEDVNRAREQYGLGEHEQKPGLIGSMLKAAKEAVVGKNNNEDIEVREHSPNYTTHRYKDTSENTGSKVGEYTDYAAQKTKETKDYAVDKAKEAKDTTINKAGEYKDYTVDKAKQAKDATMNKAGEYTDYAAEKAKEAKDVTAEKAKEGKDTTVGKLGELKDSAADAAKRAMGFFIGKKDETKEKVSETGEEARRKMEELRVQDKDYNNRSKQAPRVGGGQKLVIEVEESRPGVIADALETADKATTQAMNEEGVIRVERREKM
ncbi:PREDICTED: embryonic protein DC-8-like isoform X2 [Lupinus angustifolius]|uniref:embryonic protein DC-8-like isoform X2 n=1 Tax=Lupinus angustifolius TaxID=3871 RepID=UPI00092F41F5|nr:PREDICTED: embryonic protein DC-8-like isoform X2 [Lupinus angustifolius]